jgi:hypothetical protein
MKKNKETFREWNLKVLQYLKPNSVMSNACTALYKVSSTQTINIQIAAWLCSENIPHSAIYKSEEILDW